MAFRILTFISLLLLFACTTSIPISYEVLVPAGHSVPPTIKSVVLVDNSPVYRENGIHKASVDGNVQELDSFWLPQFPKMALQSLHNELLNVRFFDTVYYDTIHRSLSVDRLSYLTPNQVNELCEKYNADAVLSIDAYMYKTKIKVDQYPDVVFSVMDESGGIYWQFHDRYEQKVLFAESQRDTIFWTGEEHSLEKSVSRLPGLDKAISSLAFYMGEQMVDELVPSWAPVNRELYTSGNAYFVGALDWLNKGKPEEALKLWSYIFEHGKKRNKAKAANNIAVILEQQDKIVGAMEWAYNAYMAYVESGSGFESSDRKKAKEYYQYLSLRAKELEKLKIQVGGN